MIHYLKLFICFIVISLYIGQSVDNTTNLLLEWSENVQSIYNNVLIYEDGDIFPLQDSKLFSWTDSRLEYMCKLRQDVLSNARMARAEYLFVSHSSSLNFLFLLFSLSIAIIFL